jgi:hypothetical protein
MENHDDSFAQPRRTCDDIARELALFTDEQRSLAWSPEPPYERTGGHDCRIGGTCGLDFSRESRRARWVQARHRWRRNPQYHVPLQTL